jgi:hypothetical protein
VTGGAKRGPKSKAEQVRILLDEIATLVPMRCPVLDHASQLYFVVIVPSGEEPKQYADVCPGCGVDIDGVQYVVVHPSPEFLQNKADRELWEKLREEARRFPRVEDEEHRTRDVG